MNVLGMSMTVTSLFSLASTMLVNITDSVLKVVELESSLVIYICCLLPPATVSTLILPSRLCLRNLCGSNTIWISSYIISQLFMGIRVFLSCSCFISLLDAECALSPHSFKPALKDNWVMIDITTSGRLGKNIPAQTYVSQYEALPGSLVVSWHMHTFFMSW